VRWILIVLVAVHGLIHLMGFLKAFGLAEFPQLTQPISRPAGLLWLAAAVLMVATAAALAAWPRGWWMIAALAVVVSQLAIASAWSDARFGTVANAVLLLGVVYGCLTQGPPSFRAEYERWARAGTTRPVETRLVTEADLAPLPDPVRRYLRGAGVVGQPRVRSYRLRFRGRIRSGPDARWMPFVAEQQSFVDVPERLFWMRARMLGVPVEAFHRLARGHASMRVRVAGAVPIVDARGPVMDRSEAVTLFNDMCILAPASLLEPSVAWEPVDARTARARFTNGAETISATLFFDGEGMLSGFVSDDRSRSSPDGKTFTRLPFSTPVSEYRRFGPFRIAARGEARFRPPEGEFTYGEFELLDLAYNVDGTTSR
jgi:hypothetical protein